MRMLMAVRIFSLSAKRTFRKQWHNNNKGKTLILLHILSAEEEKEQTVKDHVRNA